MIPWWAHQLLSTLVFLLTLVFVSSILRARRAAGSTLAWLFLICALPYVGIPFYLLLSGRKFKTLLKKKSKIYRSSAPQTFPENLSTTQRILWASGIPEAKLNHLIELLPTGVDAYNKIIQLIRGAQRSIHITTFIFGNDVVGNTVVEELVKKAAAGIDVRILVDSLGATLIRHPSFTRFIHAGGKIAYFMPMLHLPFQGRSNLRNHRKLMIVDEKFAVLGGMNLAQEYLGPTPDPNRWVDLGLQLEGDCVHDLEELFLQDWAYATHKNRSVTVIESPGAINGNFLAQVVASGPDVVGDPLYDVLLSAINESKTSVWIVTPYFIPDESLAKALELAAKRGVAIHVIIPLRSNHRLADLARGSFVRQLTSVGVHFGFFPKMIHAKALLVDRKLAILGSANFDMRSLLLNYEVGLAIYSEAALQAVEMWILQRQNETTFETPKSGYWRELVEGIGRVIGPIL